MLTKVTSFNALLRYHPLNELATILNHVQTITTYADTRQSTVGAMHKNFTYITLALCLMLFSTYYAQNNAGKISTGLSVSCK